MFRDRFISAPLPGNEWEIMLDKQPTKPEGLLHARCYPPPVHSHLIAIRGIQDIRYKYLYLNSLPECVHSLVYILYPEITWEQIFYIAQQQCRYT